MVRIPGFVFDRRIYQGSATIVYGGVREADQLAVVGKMVRGGARDLSEERSLLERLKGPGVAEALGVFDSSEGPVLVQRYFGTGTLRDVVAAGPLEPLHAVSLMTQLAEVLVRVHAARVVHRDIKPANVLYDEPTQSVALADFGMALELPVNARSLPVTDLVGTPAYVAPEQTGRTTSGCDARSDLYSLGITFYELVTGRAPFVSDDLLEVVSAHLSQLPEPPSVRRPAVPEAVSAIIMKLCAKAPADRYQSARGLLADLRTCHKRLERKELNGAFELGRSDTLLPKRPKAVLGRETELATLATAYSAAAAAETRLVLLAGTQGSGGSALLNEMLRRHPRAQTALGACKEGQAAPLSGIRQALEALARGLLMLDDERLSSIRQRLVSELGPIARVMTDLAPTLEDVLGAQPSLPQLGVNEERARLRYAFRRFMAALGAEHVCVFALSNYENADPATVSLVEALLEETSSRVLVVLLAHDAKVFGTWPSMPCATSLELGPLSAEATTAWVREAFDLDEVRAAEIAPILHDKSGGNPSLLRNLLTYFTEQGVIERVDGQYTWSLESVRAAQAPPTLASLVSQRVKGLPRAQLELLATLSVDENADVEAIAAFAQLEPEAAKRTLATLEREGVVAGSKGQYSVAHPAIASAALLEVPAPRLRELTARLANHLLRTISSDVPDTQAFRVARVVAAAEGQVDAELRLPAARLLARAGEHVTRAMAYDTASRFFSLGVSLAQGVDRSLQFTLQVGRARALMMLGDNDGAEVVFKSLCDQDLSPSELGIAYPSRVDNRSVISDRDGAIAISLEGLARLGVKMPENPSMLRALAMILTTDRKLAKLTTHDHVNRPEATDERAVAALRILSTMTTTAYLARRTTLYLVLCETAISLILKYGHVRQTSGFLGTHSSVVNGALAQRAKARHTHQACLELERARPAPELYGRTSLVLYYMLHPWFASWRESSDQLTEGVKRAVEVGDPVFATLLASSALTMCVLRGVPFDRVLATHASFQNVLNADRSVAGALAVSIAIAAKIHRGDEVLPADLDRLTKMPAAAGSLRQSPMVNYGLALTVVGHEQQVRAWVDEIRDSFAKVCLGMPQIANLWLLDGVFAARDARAGQPARLKAARRIVAHVRKVQRSTGATNFEPFIALLDAEIARSCGQLDTASGLYGRAAAEARARDLIHLVAFANEERALMLRGTGSNDEADLFTREALIAYRRWGHQTKVLELEKAHPELGALDLHEGAARRMSSAMGLSHSSGSKPKTSSSRSINEGLDLATVLKVSQEISTQLQASGVVRTVLGGIAQNAGADRVLFIQRMPDGHELAYGEWQGNAYQELLQPIDVYAELPRSLLVLLRRTSRSVVISDAQTDAAHANDDFVRRRQCRSLAGIPIIKKGALAGYVLLENRLAPAAFTPQLISITQALISQAAISLDNASLYEDMESRVRDRTAALHARNAEMRLVLDNVVQGLAIVDLKGRVSDEASAMLRRWYPDGVPTTVMGFFAHDRNAQGMMSIAWEQLTDGFLPVELCIDQLPHKLERDGRVFDLTWAPITSAEGALERVLLVMSDVTDMLRAQESEAEQRQQMALFRRLNADRAGVLEFIAESTNLVNALSGSGLTPELEKRLVHTLKGNTALFGLHSLSAQCHEVESAMLDEHRSLSDAERSSLSRAWNSVVKELRPFLEVGADVVSVRRADYDEVLSALAREGHRLANELEVWRLERLETRLTRVSEQTAQLAERLGKAPVNVKLEHDDIRLEASRWAPFWSAFVHAVRNAVDHGLESKAERERLGKGVGTVTLRSYFDEHAFVFELSDDGRGIAWPLVRIKAQERGLPVETQLDLVNALFHDGLSTKEVVDEHSGRGVGMGALRQACVELGGRIEVTSAAGQGTTWRFIFPREVARQRGPGGGSTPATPKAA